MMNCTETRRFLHAYLDGEFDERERVEFEFHLMHCSVCHDEVSYYQALRTKLREEVPCAVAPVALEATIRCALRHDSEKVRPVMTGLSFSMAALMACVVVGGISLWPRLANMLTPQLASHGGAALPKQRNAAIRVTPVSIPATRNGFVLPVNRTLPATRTSVSTLKQRLRIMRCLRYRRSKGWLRYAAYRNGQTKQKNVGFYPSKQNSKAFCDGKMDPFSPACYANFSTLCSEIH